MKRGTCRDCGRPARHAQGMLCAEHEDHAYQRHTQGMHFTYRRYLKALCELMNLPWPNLKDKLLP